MFIISYCVHTITILATIIVDFVIIITTTIIVIIRKYTAVQLRILMLPRVTQILQQKSFASPQPIDHFCCRHMRRKVGLFLRNVFVSLLLKGVVSLKVKIAALNDALTGTGKITRSMLRGSNVLQEVSVRDESLAVRVIPVTV
jgi:hypothetical protein